MIYGLPTSHVHGAITVVPLTSPLLAFPPRVLHLLRRVGGGFRGHGNVCHGRKPGATDWRRESVLIPRAVDSAEGSDWQSGAVAPG